MGGWVHMPCLALVDKGAAQGLPPFGCAVCQHASADSAMGSMSWSYLMP